MGVGGLLEGWRVQCFAVRYVLEVIFFLIVWVQFDGSEVACHYSYIMFDNEKPCDDALIIIRYVCKYILYGIFFLSAKFNFWKWVVFLVFNLSLGAKNRYPTTRPGSLVRKRRAFSMCHLNSKQASIHPNTVISETRPTNQKYLQQWRCNVLNFNWNSEYQNSPLQE
jgi:hypothetical protein